MPAHVTGADAIDRAPARRASEAPADSWISFLARCSRVLRPGRGSKSPVCVTCWKVVLRTLNPNLLEGPPLVASALFGAPIDVPLIWTALSAPRRPQPRMPGGNQQLRLPWSVRSLASGSECSGRRTRHGTLALSVTTPPLWTLILWCTTMATRGTKRLATRTCGGNCSRRRPTQSPRGLHPSPRRKHHQSPDRPRLFPPHPALRRPERVTRRRLPGAHTRLTPPGQRPRPRASLFSGKQGPHPASSASSGVGRATRHR
jgi:hypothetical protein